MENLITRGASPGRMGKTLRLAQRESARSQRLVTSLQPSSEGTGLTGQGGWGEGRVLSTPG